MLIKVTNNFEVSKSKLYGSVLFICDVLEVHDTFGHILQLETLPLASASISRFSSYLSCPWKTPQYLSLDVAAE